MKDIRNYSLLAHNTFGIDAKCKRFLEYSSVEEAQQIVADKKCRLCLINSKRKVQRDHATSDQPTLTATELKQIDFIEVAKMYIESEGVTFDDEMLEMLQEVKEMLNSNQE